MKARTFCAVWLLGLAAFASGRVMPGQQPAKEATVKQAHRVLGDLPFSYSYANTLKLARQNGKPIFAYFTYAT
jgi:hypothetical protein